MSKNILDKSVQASVQRAIDNDQLFSLKHISQLKELIRLNITVMVDPNTSQNYSCMTLIQYAIKQNKPDALEYLLNVAVESGMQPKDILRSDFKYENNNLLFLAIDFNSNLCLKTLIAFFKGKDKNFSVDISDPFGESPLTRAIKLGNEEAISILLSNGASLFYFDQSKNKLSTFMPILCIFFYNKEKDKLDHIFNDCIEPNIVKEGEDKTKLIKIIQDFSQMNFTDNFLKVDHPSQDSKNIKDLFFEKNLTDAREYLNNFKEVDDESISTITHESKDSGISKSNIAKPNEKPRGKNKCYFCKNTEDHLDKCTSCGVLYCNKCEHEHSMKCSEIQNKQ